MIDTISKIDDVHIDKTTQKIRASAYELAVENSDLVNNIPSGKTLDEKILDVLVAGYVESDKYTENTLQSVMKQRRFFITKAGHLGVGPAGTTEGHIVCVIAGCNFPMVLCKEGDRYLVVGEAYGEYT